METLAILIVGLTGAPAAIVLARMLWREEAAGRVNRRRAAWLGWLLVAVAGFAVGMVVMMLMAVFSGSSEWAWIVGAAGGGTVSAVLLVRTGAWKGPVVDRLWRVALCLVPMVGAAAVCAAAEPLLEEQVLAPTWAMVRAALIMGLVASAALLLGGLMGDRSRGRRRCPKCWYDMIATPGLRCPECGVDARREARLFKTRRRKWMIAASLLPALGAAGVWGAWASQEGRWLRAMPTTALIGMSPWLEPNTRMADELSLRVDAFREEMPGWQRRLMRWQLSSSSTDTDNPVRAQRHLRWLLGVHEQPPSTLDVLIRMSEGSDPVAVAGAASLLGELPDPSMLPEVERVLTKLCDHTDTKVQLHVIRSLLAVKLARPGGPAPAMLCRTAASFTGRGGQLACWALMQYDTSDEVISSLRAAVVAAPDSWRRGAALASLARHVPDDDGVRALLVVEVRDPGNGSNLIASVLRSDELFMNSSGELSPERRAMYSDDVRKAMIDAYRAAGSNDTWWGEGLLLLRKHPCFTEEERAAFRSEDPIVPHPREDDP